MKGITLNNKFFPIDYLLNYDKNLVDNNFSDYEKKTLDFCSQWVCGKTYFNIKTSGSTGIPKDIFLTRNQLITSAKMTIKALALKENDKALVCLSIEHIAGIMMLVRGFTADLKLNIITPSSNPFISFSNDVSFDFTALVPLQLYEIINKTPEKIDILNKMKAIIIGGSSISSLLLKQIQEFVKSPIYHTFGMTETVSHIALKKLNDKTNYYQVLDGVKIAKDNRNCLTINSKVTNNQTIITNDIVEIIGNDKFIWLGRIDNVINTGSLKVQTETVEKAIEKVLFEYDNNKFSNLRFFVNSKKDEKFENIIILILESKEFSKKEIDDIKKLLSNFLKKYEIPREFYFMENFIETSTGKIDKIKTKSLLFI